jgi:thiol-disulfide isomerase/thioredoxin
LACTGINAGNRKFVGTPINNKMKKLIYMAAVIILSFSCSDAQKSTFSTAALENKLQASNGSTPTFEQILEKHKGKTTVIEVWASWCGDCVKAMPQLKEMQIKHPEVDYVFISVDKAEDKWKAGIEKHDLQGDHYFVTDGMKGAFGKAIDLDWIPRYIILDREGNIVTYRAIEKDFEAIDKTLNTLK